MKRIELTSVPSRTTWPLQRYMTALARQSRQLRRAGEQPVPPGQYRQKHSFTSNPSLLPCGCVSWLCIRNGLVTCPRPGERDDLRQGASIGASLLTRHALTWRFITSNGKTRRYDSEMPRMDERGSASAAGTGWRCPYC